ncbi:cell wall glucanase, putative [Talaromyces stipitatus ATCC 10500]|uniref:chitinase n=1 Tax=Talaromyces stipitatus (strain ATCC 10500 / CBS 375.48 / QM 6759 / NRRL 1006) TaxID=441959 RepID=B8MCD7_TALSN|nr:cell wall glucanase, putative [Talaromyces stipitatus ATCC 10500]XP_002482576.1 cell wall glucanase, putative [Talaromyces stipitatus ATCC 10500]EED18583.1 cell wall glucanase, putative [Talaromyces stipitatus ATCC 10500]EED18584.1 cell wall glucanase, putative [Talaromyces stipitatus ATCC 10500]
MMRSSVLAALVAALVSTVSAQTTTNCQPLNETCPPDLALGTAHTWNLSSSSQLDDTWNITNGVMNYTEDALGFTINKKLDSPTIISTFYIFFGRLEYHVRAAPGHGVISSVVLQSDDLDEVDWEWVGSEETTVQTNFFGKGQTIEGTAKYFNISGSTHDTYHNYTTWWDKDKLQWWVDGQLLRTVTPAEASNSTYDWYPQTPMTIRIGAWPGGDPSGPPGRIEWAGGVIDYNAGPYTMFVSQVSAQDFTTGKEYNYTDHSGTWESINVVAGNSTVSKELNAVHLSAAQRWNNLSSGAKIAIIVSVSAVVGIGALVFLFCCIRQRRIGKREWNAQNNQWTQERTDMMNMQAEWRQKGYVEMK